MSILRVRHLATWPRAIGFTATQSRAIERASASNGRRFAAIAAFAISI